MSHTGELLLAVLKQQLGIENGECGEDICILWGKVWIRLFGKEQDLYSLKKNRFASFDAKEGLLIWGKCWVYIFKEELYIF